MKSSVLQGVDPVDKTTVHFFLASNLSKPEKFSTGSVLTALFIPKYGVLDLEILGKVL